MRFFVHYVNDPADNAAVSKHTPPGTKFASAAFAFTISDRGKVAAHHLILNVKAGQEWLPLPVELCRKLMKRRDLEELKDEAERWYARPAHHEDAHDGTSKSQQMTERDWQKLGIAPTVLPEDFLFGKRE